MLPAPALTVLGVAVTALPYNTNVPYSKITSVDAPLSFMIPPKVALVLVMLDALPVVAVGAVAYVY